jgi:alcohol dehydrogenase class IV
MRPAERSQLGTTLDGLLAGIQRNTSFLKALCKLALTPGITQHLKAVRFAKRHVMRRRVRDLGTSIGPGLGKAIALESSLSMIAIPTTYAGSEMTPVYGDRGRSESYGARAAVLPKTVIYHSQLSRELPPGLSFVSGVNVIAHAAERLYANDGNPIISLMAEDRIRALATGLRGVKNEPQSLVARSGCLYGAWRCGCVLGHVEMELHHELHDAPGASFNLPHAQTHAIILPHGHTTARRCLRP